MVHHLALPGWWLPPIYVHICILHTCTKPTQVVNPRRGCTAWIAVVGLSVCLCVCNYWHLMSMSGASVRLENAVTYSTDNEGQKNCSDFSETTLLQRSSSFCIVRLSFVGHSLLCGKAYMCIYIYHHVWWTDVVIFMHIYCGLACIYAVYTCGIYVLCTQCIKGLHFSVHFIWFWCELWHLYVRKEFNSLPQFPKLGTGLS